MHYYDFHIADYRKDTGHLTIVEHYIYRSLIDWYYLDEKPIPKITQLVSRRLSLVSEQEQSLINVLDDFFILQDDGWHHGKIDEDIIKYHAKAKQNRVNGSKGGRPKNQQVIDKDKPKKTQPVNSGNPKEPNRNPNQEPITNNHKPSKEKGKIFSPPSLEQVTEYKNERQSNIDPERFIDFYKSKGWLIGKSKMKDWKASFRNWEKRNAETKNNQGISKSAAGQVSALERISNM